MTFCTVQPEDLERFIEFYTVDQGLGLGTAQRHRGRVKRLLAEEGSEISTDNVRAFLGRMRGSSDYNNYIKSFRIFFRDFKKQGEIVDPFKFTHSNNGVPLLYSRKELYEFFNALPNPLERTLFLIYASSGRRRNEVLHLTKEQIDLKRRIILPGASSSTKGSWYSFFNLEAEDELKAYLKLPLDHSRHLFPMRSTQRDYIFTQAQRKTGLKITPRSLRFWFSNEMARLGVPDRFIDAFQGRIPRSVLARHYTDYSLENLKHVYDKAGLKINGGD